MNGCIAGIQYIPSIEYFAHWHHHGLLTIEQYEHYQKRTWRNKTAILSPDEPLILTVPLRKGKHQQKLISEVQIAYDEPWINMHLKSLKTAYSKTAYFDEVISGLEDLLMLKYEKLWDLNLDCLHYITALIGGRWDIELSNEYLHQYPVEIVDLRAGVRRENQFRNKDEFPAYQQVQRLHGSHLANLSIFDVLCHLGPETNQYLARYATKLYEKP
ncbi:MAG TPA: WbqC family protein [Saprospiraceae bacterium]|nr:WbqC family protein [Saprospiraceae bacterium]